MKKLKVNKYFVCVMCVCVYYYCWIDYYHSLIIVLFYSLGSRYCTTCVQGFKECCVEECKDRRKSPKQNCLYCMYHSNPNNRCHKCRTRSFADGSKLCFTCNLLCRTYNCKNRLVDGSSLCSDCNLLCRKWGCENRLTDGSGTLCST